MPLILASLGLGSMALGGWAQNNKPLLLAIAACFMSLSLIMAIREKMKTGRNRDLFIFGLAFAITAALISYNKVRYGYFI